MRTTALIFIMLNAFATGCVTVKLGGGESQRAEGVQTRPPGGAFSAEKRDDVDAMWKNTRNGNAISYLSDCKDPSDPPLDNIVQGILAGLTDLKVEERETTTMQGREARRVMASGKVDGVPSGIDLLVFKRNHCIYILTYVGVKAAFPENRGDFNAFIQGFRAP